MPYIVGTGYHDRIGRGQDWFWHLWLDNTLRHSRPNEIIVLATGGVYPETLPGEPASNWIYLSGDLGHCGQLISGQKPHHFCGGTAGALTLAMLCYCSECDLIYKEQDMLAFGPYVETMYREIGNRGCIFGSIRSMPSQQSLMLVRHGFIPDLVRLYLGTGSEQKPENVSECKFARLEREHPDLFCRYSFGYDRDRPFNVKDKVWCAQKFTSDELRKIAEAGLIPGESLRDMPEMLRTTFSNA